ncbi:MAG TPA: type II secretion system protein [Verrucomicrobiota bacterium]|nr:type II secretion system protein [Verrucomicrobiota bacterium]
MGRGQCKNKPLCNGFTLVELLVVVAIIAILSALLLTAIASSKTKGTNVQCMSNMRQLQMAWLMYEHDFSALPPNNDQPDAGKSPNRPSWVAGWLRLDSQEGDKTDSTNTTLLVGEQYAAFGSIGPYTKSPKLYKCPLDHSTVNIGGINYPRVRTVSMNAYMNGTGVWQDTNYVTFRKINQIPDASKMWVFIEEREDSINDGYFAIKADAKYAIIDTPASYHNKCGIISFADGHVEVHKWLEQTTMPPLTPGVHLSGVPIYTTINDRDMKWLMERTTIPVEEKKE